MPYGEKAPPQAASGSRSAAPRRAKSARARRNIRRVVHDALPPVESRGQKRAAAIAASISDSISVKGSARPPASAIQRCEGVAKTATV